MQVDVSGHQFVFPTVCACCNGRADTELTVSTSKSTGKRVIRTSSNEWDIPYCKQCVLHVKAVESAKMLTWVLGAFSVVVAGRSAISRFDQGGLARRDVAFQELQAARKDLRGGRPRHRAQHWKIRPPQFAHFVANEQFGTYLRELG
jgi:hypothetical protein